MKRLVLLTLALLMVAMPTMAQLPGNIPVPDCFRFGKVLVAIGATDTLHFTDTNPLLESTKADRWQGYETVYVPNGSNGYDTKRAFVTGAVLYCDKPFAVKPVYRNGDAETITIFCDTIQSGVVDYIHGANVDANKFPVWQTLKGDLSRVITTIGSADSLFCIP